MNNLSVEIPQNYSLDKDVLDQIYNLDQKIKFVEDQYGNQQINARENILRFFSNTGEIEQSLRKDLNKFNNIEMEELFKTLNIVSKASFSNRKTIIRKYFEWSFTQKLIALKDFSWFNSFSISNLETFNLGYKKYFKDFEDLQDGINTILSKLNPIDNEQYAICYITMYLRWFGLSVEECCNLKVSQIDFETGIIKLENKTVKINDTVLKIISESLKKDGYTTGFKTRNASRDFLYKQSDYVIRKLADSNTDNYNPKDLQQRISIFISCTNELKENDRFYNHTFFLKDIYDSGIFYRILQYEKENKVDIENIDRDILLGLLYVNELTASKENNFKQDYKNWKNIFYGV